jgi:hypothetical protein
VGSLVVKSTSDVEDATIAVTATLDGAGTTEGADAERTVLAHPSDGVGVTAEDFILVNFDFLAAKARHGALAAVFECLSGVDTALNVCASDPEFTRLFLASNDRIRREILALSQHPVDRTRLTLVTTALSVLEPVLETPCFGFAIFLVVLMVLVSHVSTSENSCTGHQATTDLDLLTTTLIEIVPVLLLLMLVDLDTLLAVLIPGCSGSSGLLLLVLLLLVLLLAAMVLLTTVVSAIAILHAAPEGGGLVGCPVTLTPVGLDDLVIVAVVAHNITIVVLCSGFPRVDHFER